MMSYLTFIAIKCDTNILTLWLYNVRNHTHRQQHTAAVITIHSNMPINLIISIAFTKNKKNYYACRYKHTMLFLTRNNCSILFIPILNQNHLF